ncbi:MAG: DUF1552 domain-containing protein [Vicinamibacterales bacterium]
MMITRMALPRRTVLRGIGAALSLPYLDSMVPAFAAPAPALRYHVTYVPNSVSQPYWRPKSVDGKLTDLGAIMAPLEAFKSQIVVVEGMGNATVDGGGGPHTRSSQAWLTGVPCKRTEGADVELATTVDQLAARVLSRDTQLISLEMATEPNFTVGNCDNGYSCVYANTFVWRTPTTPLPMENNPRAVFERLFGDGGTASARMADLRNDRSILDSVRSDMTRLQKRVGASDRLMMDEYFQAVREVEQRIQKVEQQNAASPIEVGDKPSGIPDTFDEHVRLLFDLQVLAFQADVTRVMTYQLSREQTSRPYPFIGVPEAHHDVSHHQNNPEKLLKHAKINTYHMSHYARFLTRLKELKDGDGSVFDHMIGLYGTGLGDGDLHSALDLPTLLTGGGSGTLKGGRHLKFPPDSRMTNLHLNILRKLGAPQEKLGDSTGELAEL